MAAPSISIPGWWEPVLLTEHPCRGEMWSHGLRWGASSLRSPVSLLLSYLWSVGAQRTVWPGPSWDWAEDTQATIEHQIMSDSFWKLGSFCGWKDISNPLENPCLLIIGFLVFLVSSSQTPLFLAPSSLVFAGNWCVEVLTELGVLTLVHADLTCLSDGTAPSRLPVWLV